MSRSADIDADHDRSRDLYTTDATRGSGTTKAGLCPICLVSEGEGGEGKSIWLSLKFSAYKWYVSLYYSSLITSGTDLREGDRVFSFCVSRCEFGIN